MAKGEMLSLSLSSAERENLEKIAIAFGQTRGNVPNLTGLMRAISNGELKVSFAQDPEGCKQKSRLKNTIKKLADELRAIESAL